MTFDIAPVRYWMLEREAIRMRRAAGQPPPWTTDPVLAQYRFCNVRREDDRVTIWVRERIREPYANHPNLWFMLCLARFINWPPTLQYLMDKGVWPTDAYDRRGVTAALDELAARGVKVWTGAYLIKGDSAKRPVSERRKSFYVANTVLNSTWARRDVIMKRFPLGLEQTHRAISSIYGWGPFLAFQAIVDMRFTEILSGAPDAASWAAAGPGTIRGLNRTHGRPPGRALSQAQALREMRAVYPALKEIAEIDFSDVPNIFCETDKLLRTQIGDGRPKTIYRSEIWPQYDVS